jgi:hypothetical protein
MKKPELLQVVEPDLDSVTDETLHMIIALDDFGLRPSLEMAQVICRRLIRAERQVADLIRERDEARAELIRYAGTPYGKIATEAEARGFERGVKEAAKACDWGDIYGDNAVKCILALLEKPTS